MKNNWNKFWDKRKGQHPSQRPFWEGFHIIKESLDRVLGDAKGKCLEVGAGRGCMSNFLRDDGWDTYCMDKYYIPPENGNDHKFFKADAFDIPFPEHFFDLVFSYGLLEHFEQTDQMILLQEMLDKTKDRGVSIHYIVPEKLTNVFEDKDVYRDPCRWLRHRPVQWVYPIVGKEWKTNKYLGKGFWYEDFGFSYSEID